MNWSRFLLNCLVIVLLLTSLALLLGCASEEKVQTVGLTQIVSHPALDSVREGIIKGLAESGFVDGKNIKIDFKNANGDPSLCLPIAQSFVRQNVDVIVPITTPSALAAAKSTKDIPIVFAGITDPLGIGLVGSLERPGGNISGTSDRWPFEKQVQLFSELIPNLKTIGMLYRPGDDVSAVAVKDVTDAGKKYDIKVVTVPVSSAGDVYRTSSAVLTKVDAIYTGLDNLVVENLESVLKAAREQNKPVLSGDIGTVERGGLATYSISMEELGRVTGGMVAAVLKGEATATMPVQIVSSGQAVINKSAEMRFDLTAASVNNFKIEYVQ